MLLKCCQGRLERYHLLLKRLDAVPMLECRKCLVNIGGELDGGDDIANSNSDNTHTEDTARDPPIKLSVCGEIEDEFT